MSKGLEALEAVVSLRTRLVEKGIKDQFLEELISIENSLKALEIIKEEFLNRGDFIFRFEYTSDAMLVIEEWIMNNKINEMKIPFNRNYYDLLKEILL